MEHKGKARKHKLTKEQIKQREREQHVNMINHDINFGKISNHFSSFFQNFMKYLAEEFKTKELVMLMEKKDKKVEDEGKFLKKDNSLEK